ncbi:MAG: hypothetical protein A2W31_15725 [Planctomycetes bacterium RBG_16_64_10]|nr:MAG: hypothetical protein A2W31_15725 [Planctomycetes bacterium RBG_16_64_10]
MVRTILLVAALSGCFTGWLGRAAASGTATEVRRGGSVPGGSVVGAEGVALRDKVRQVLRIHFQRSLNSRDHSPWAIMHSVIAFGVDTQIRLGGPQGTPVTAIGWLCFNRNTRGQQLFFPVDQGFGVHHGPGLQGHNGQLLSILAQAHVMPDYAIQVGGRDFTVADLVEYEKRTCVARTELTFKLIGLSHYLDLNATWQCRNGEQWSIPRLIREELAQPIQGATCGGTHRLMGLSYALRTRAKRGEPIVGEYHRAQIFVQDYHQYTFRLQNQDGSFSTDWYRGRENRPDPVRKLQTTGHILEWLAYSLPRQELEDGRTIRAVDFLSSLILAGGDREWEIGSLGHALHALVLYDQRVFGGTADDYRPILPPAQAVAATPPGKAPATPPGPGPN